MGHLLTVLLFTLGWLLTACGSDTDEPTDDSNTPTTATDTTAPTLAEVRAVTTSTNDTTPAYTFSSTEAGTITYGGSCTSSTTSVSSGNNVVNFSTLSEGTYSNCTITVTGATGNVTVPQKVHPRSTN